MRRALLTAAIILLALLSSILLVPVLLKGRVIDAILSQANAQLDATVSLADADLSLLASFPELTVTLHGLKVDNEGAFAGTTLAEVETLTLRTDLMSAIRGEDLELLDLALTRPTLDIQINAAGESNLDIFPESDDDAEDSGGFSLSLQGYRVQQGQLRYVDEAGGTRVSLTGLDHEGRGDFTQDVVALDTQTTLDTLSVTSGGVELLREASLRSSLALQYHQDTGAIELSENQITLNALTLSLLGRAAPIQDGWDLDLQIEELNSSFKELLSLVPAVYSDSFEGLGTTGSFSLSGQVKGLLPAEGDDLPGFKLALGVTDGSFKDPSLPSAISGIQLKASLDHPGGGLDAMVIDVPTLRMRVQDSPLTGRVRLAHLETDPSVDLEMVGRLDLAKLKGALPAAAASYEGLLDADLRLRGRVSEFEAANATNLQADGRFGLQGFSWVDPELDMPIRIPKLDLSLDPQRATIHALDMDLEAFQFSANGHLDNIVAWALSDAPLSGELSLRSQKIDLDALPSSDQDEAAEGSSIVVVPDGYDLVFNADVGTLVYGGHSFEDFKGRVIVRSGAVTLEGMNMKLLGGALGIDGSYAATGPDFADVDIVLSFGDPEVAAALKNFEVLRRLAAVFEGAGGRFNTQVHVRTRLGPDLSPDYSSLWTEGKVKTFDMAFQPSFGAGLASTLGAERFSKMRLDNQSFRFKVEGGKMRFQPFDLSVGGQPATLSGDTGVLDDALNLVLEMQLPATQLQSSALASQLAGLSADKVPVRVMITGTRSAPKLRLDLAGAGQALVGDLKAEATAQVDAVKAEVTQQVDALASQAVEAARLKGDQLVATAETQAGNIRSAGATQAKNVRDEAKAKAKQLRREAKGNPIKEAAADRAADALVAEAEKAATKIEREANAKADALVAEAKASRTQLVSEAEAKLQR